MEALFLDRDGVLNRRPEGRPVCHPDELFLLPGVPEAVAMLNRHFDHTFIVTNQQGVAQGLLTEADLAAIHDKLIAAIAAAGGRIDRIYHCPYPADSGSHLRKPNIGMALLARHDTPGLRLRDCTMVGDSETDMLFGRRAHMHTVLVGEWPAIASRQPRLVDNCYPDLITYARSLMYNV